MRLRRFGFLIGVGAACLAAWSLPSTEPDGALGRFTYPELLLALAAALALLGTALVTFAPASRRRRWLFKVLAVSLGSLAALAGFELFAALASPKENPFYHFNDGGVSAETPVDPRLPFLRPPHLKWEGWTQGDTPEWMPDPPDFRRRITFQTDADGFRNSQDIAQADLVFIGDSYTEAGNVLEEETFVRLTAEKLNRSARNLGLYNYAPQPELILLEQFGLKCDPKVVVWQLCESNDLRGARRHAEAMRRWQDAGRPPVDRLPTKRQTPWEQRSPTFALFQSLVQKKRTWLQGTVRDREGRAYEMRFGYWPDPDHFPLGHRSAPWGTAEHPGWKPIVESLHAAKAQLDERGITLVVLFIPMKLTVFADTVALDELSRLKARSSLVVPPAESLATQLNRVCAESGIPFVDTTPNLRKAAAAGELVYFLNDTHLSPRGHEIVSEMLVDVLDGFLAAQP